MSKKRSGMKAAFGMAAVMGLIALAPTLSGDFSNTARAEDTKLASTSKAPAKYSVPVKDMSTSRPVFIRDIAAQVSNNAIIVLYRGSDKDLQNEVRSGASLAKNSGIYVRGMIIGPADGSFRDRDSFVIYADGLPIGDPFDASSNPRNIAEEAIRQVHNMIRETKVLDLDDPPPPEVAMN